MISYQEFRRVWLDALEIDDVDQYIAEVGGSLDAGGLRRTIQLLADVHRLARGDVREMRAFAGISQAEFARRYAVSASTLNKWEMGISAPSEWARQLMAYALIGDAIEGEDP